MSTTKDNPVWSMIFWGVPTVGLLGFGIACINDGWFRADFPKAEFNRWVTPIVFLAALWCAREGWKEYRRVKQKVAQGGPGADETKPGQGGESAGGDDRGKPA